MTIIWHSPSHISGKSVLELTGVDRIEVDHSASLNISQNITIGIMLQPQGLNTVPSNYALITKGDPTNPATGSFFIEARGGQVRVYLHDVNGVNSLVMESIDPILNTRKISHLVIAWDYTNKYFNMYLNDKAIPCSIVTGGSFYSSVSSMGLLNTNLNKVIVGEAPGKNNAAIKIFHTFIAASYFSHEQVGNVYDLIKYLGSYTPQDKMLFSSTQGTTGRYSLFIMNEDGSDRELLYSGTANYLRPRISSNSNYVSFTAASIVPAHPGLGVASASMFYMPYPNSLGIPCDLGSPGENNQITPRIKDNSGYIFGIQSGGTSYIRRKLFPALTTPVDLITGTIETYTGFDASDLDNSNQAEYPFLFYITNSVISGDRLWKTDLDPSSSSVVLDSTGAGNNDMMYGICVNKQGDKIAYTKKVGAYFQVFVCNPDGSGLLQITTDAFDNFLSGFTSSGLKVIVNTYDTGTSKYQIHTMDLAGGNRYNISNNYYQDWHGEGI